MHTEYITYVFITRICFVVNYSPYGILSVWDIDCMGYNLYGIISGYRDMFRIGLRLSISQFFCGQYSCYNEQTEALVKLDQKT